MSPSKLVAFQANDATYLYRVILVLTLVSLVLESIVSGQRQPRRQLVKKYKRPPNMPRNTHRINCPICHGDYMAKKVTIDDPCFNPRYSLATAELELVSECPLASRNCTTETVYINGVLTSIRRKCGPANACSDSCVVAGLGLTSKTCAICCPPFEFDTYNTDLLKPKECA